jgi:tRNA guanosine-2'-O-methyltransferase
MIVGGNWIVGHYKNDYFDLDSGNDVKLKQLLAAVIPWLSSTQGFSRAIAQLLVHKLTPLCVDVSNMSAISPNEVDWFPRLIFRFLDENREMKRLRKKQGTFFERYTVEEMYTPEGVLSIPVDEGDEADPVHMVDAMKDILKNMYSDTHGADVPAWKQVEQLLKFEHGNDESTANEVNFQRKIIPLDSLNLAMEDLRQKRVRNAAGQKKQQLIVCASLIDKVPNLGGLARTAEIFAADRLVIPDMALTKMDNFKSLSVGAGDWIEMEEVRQEVGYEKKPCLIRTEQPSKPSDYTVIFTKICSEHIVMHLDPIYDGS